MLCQAAKILFLSSALACGALAYGSCPANLTLGELLAPVDDGTDLRLYAFDAASPIQWRLVPAQIDPLNEEGLLRDEAAMKRSATDRLAFEMDDFGEQAPETVTFPCGAKELVELRNPLADGRYAYLAWCEQGAVLTPGPTVVAEPERFRILSPFYEYVYWPRNQLLYQNMILINGNRRIAAGSASELLLHLDVKNFFDLDMTSEDVSTLTASRRTGPVGTLAMIDFYLRFLFFKINLKLTTVATFYEKSAHLPMIVDVPVHAPRILNEESGMLYHWQPDEAVIDLSHPETRFPEADAKLILQGPGKLAEAGMRYCDGGDETCVFRIRGAVKGSSSFVMDINLPQTMVERGFFPQWVQNVPSFKTSMGWDAAAKSDETGAVGIFMANSGLAKGRYKINYWIKIADGETSACPHPVQQTRRWHESQRMVH